MARNDRCTICDYSEANGSGLAGVPPGAYGKVRRHGDEHYCDECAREINQATYDLKHPEDTDEELVLLEE